MAKIYCKSSYLLRKDTAANWRKKNPVLRKGEQGLETDTGIIKIGDGVIAYNSLADDNIYFPKSYASNNFANALKGNATGQVVRLSDVSPNEHTLNVKIHSKNLWQHTGEAAYINRASYESDTHLYTVNKSGVTWYAHTFQDPIPKNTAVSVTVEVISGNGAVSIGGQHKESGKKTWQGYVDIPQNTDLSGKTYTASFITDDTVTDLCIFADVNSTIAEPVIFRVQYELGSTATSYTSNISDLTTVNVTRCGKNLIPYPYSSQSGATINGITWTHSSDGALIANGTATEDSNFVVINNTNAIPVTGQKVTLSGCPVNGGTNKYGIYYYDTVTSQYDYGEGVTFIPKGVVTINARVFKGATVNNLVFKPQLELGSTATEYEPYKTPTEYTPAADGTVSGVKSLYPTTTLMTDTAGVIINAEYNKDLNKAFAELQQAILSMGGNT